MIKKILSFPILLLALSIVFASCAKEIGTPYVIFKNADGDIITSDAWNVELETTELLYIECGFVENGYVYYERQIDDTPNSDLVFEQSDDLKILETKTQNGLNIEKTVISTTFDSNFMTHGSEVKITIRDRSKMSKTLIYIVQ